MKAWLVITKAQILGTYHTTPHRTAPHHTAPHRTIPYHCLKYEDTQTSSLMESKTIVLCKSVFDGIWEQIIVYARSVLAAVLGIVWIEDTATGVTGDLIF